MRAAVRNGTAARMDDHKSSFLTTLTTMTADSVYNGTAVFLILSSFSFNVFAFCFSLVLFSPEKALRQTDVIYLFMPVSPIEPIENELKNRLSQER